MSAPEVKRDDVDPAELPRDVLAAIAMHGLLSAGPVSPQDFVNVPTVAYHLADLMLAERAK